jgi:hypothetical protein
MKNDPTATFLNFVLAALVILGVLFALLSIWRTHNLRHLQPVLQQRAQAYQSDFVKVQALINDAITYNATVKNPELTQILQPAQTPAPAAK